MSMDGVYASLPSHTQINLPGHSSTRRSRSYLEQGTSDDLYVPSTNAVRQVYGDNSRFLEPKNGRCATHMVDSVDEYRLVSQRSSTDEDVSSQQELFDGEDVDDNAADNFLTPLSASYPSTQGASGGLNFETTYINGHGKISLSASAKQQEIQRDILKKGKNRRYAKHSWDIKTAKELDEIQQDILKKEKNRKYAKSSRDRKTQRVKELEEMNKTQECIIEIYKKSLKILYRQLYQVNPTWKSYTLDWYQGPTRHENFVQVKCSLPIFDEDFFENLGNSVLGKTIVTNNATPEMEISTVRPELNGKNISPISEKRNAKDAHKINKLLIGSRSNSMQQTLQDYLQIRQPTHISFSRPVSYPTLPNVGDSKLVSGTSGAQELGVILINSQEESDVYSNPKGIANGTLSDLPFNNSQRVTNVTNSVSPSNKITYQASDSFREYQSPHVTSQEQESAVARNLQTEDMDQDQSNSWTDLSCSLQVPDSP